MPIPFRTSSRSGYFHTSAASLAPPSLSAPPTHTLRQCQKTVAIQFSEWENRLETQVESVDKQLQCNSSTVKKKFNLSKFFSVQERIISSISWVLRSKGLFTLCPDYDIVSVLSYSMSPFPLIFYDLKTQVQG